MPLIKSKGNMYHWVTHMHSHLAGECSHRCIYCYVDNPNLGRNERFKGPLRIIDAEFDVIYGTDKTIFIEHMNDLFANDVPIEYIFNILMHCKMWPNNTYVFQSKNPILFQKLLDYFNIWPEHRIFGTTIETNRLIPNISNAPTTEERAICMMKLNERKFITLEPILDFDVDILCNWIVDIKPEFINLGADSKGHNLLEPTVEKIMELVAKLHENGIELREKHNLQRLKEKKHVNSRRNV